MAKGLLALLTSGSIKHSITATMQYIYNIYIYNLITKVHDQRKRSTEYDLSADLSPSDFYFRRNQYPLSTFEQLRLRGLTLPAGPRMDILMRPVRTAT